MVANARERQVKRNEREASDALGLAPCGPGTGEDMQGRAGHGWNGRDTVAVYVYGGRIVL